MGELSRVDAEEWSEINQLLARANYCFDHADPDGFSSCFTPNATLESSHGVYVGSQQLREFVLSAVERPAHRHFTTNTVAVSRAGNGLECESGLLYVEQTADGAAAMRVGHYLDTLTCAASGWLISHRRANIQVRTS